MSIANTQEDTESGTLDVEQTHLLDLPTEVLHLIIHKLDYRSISNLEDTCSSFVYIIESFKKVHRRRWLLIEIEFREYKKKQYMVKHRELFNPCVSNELQSKLIQFDLKQLKQLKKLIQMDEVW